MKIEWIAPEKLVPYPGNANQHPEEQIEAIAASILEFGITKPILVDGQLVIITGHGTRLGAIRAGQKKVPFIKNTSLSPRQVAAYRLADNQLAKKSKYDFELLSAEIDALISQDFDIDILGFNEQELDALLQNDSGILPEFTDGIEVKVREHTRKIHGENDFNFEQEFNSHSDETCEYPITPNFMESQECFIIPISNQIDENFIRNLFDLNKNFKSQDGKIRKSNIIKIEDVRKAFHRDTDQGQE